MVLNQNDTQKYPLIISIIHGDSMFPVFHDGDLVIARKCNAIKLGDVVIFREPMTNFFVIHRVIRNKNHRITTRGDANLTQDPNPVEQDKIFGKVCMRIPKIGILIRIIQRWCGHLCLR
ncbi:MAG: signal peptidase I [Methanoregulaceae archaeon]|jgi:signal peptidase|nr:signal peptidase I [Methanoregulaceae archaeon]